MPVDLAKIVKEILIKYKDFESDKICNQLALQKKELEMEIGQNSIRLDVVGFKDGSVWVIECKSPCTIEQFGYALGQLLCYKSVLERKTDVFKKKLKKKLGIREELNFREIEYWIALSETNKYKWDKWERELKENFELILRRNNLPFGVLKITEDSRREMVIPAEGCKLAT